MNKEHSINGKWLEVVVQPHVAPKPKWICPCSTDFCRIPRIRNHAQSDLRILHNLTKVLVKVGMGLIMIRMICNNYNRNWEYLSSSKLEIFFRRCNQNTSRPHKMVEIAHYIAVKSGSIIIYHYFFVDTPQLSSKVFLE